MPSARIDSRVTRRLINSLYVEAMLLADEARAYFEDSANGERDMLAPLDRVTFSCESLKVTTRLMHVIAWLLTQRAVEAGEIARRDALDPSRRLGAPPHSDEAVIATMPAKARELIHASIDLFRRTAHFDTVQAVESAPQSPARSMLDRLAGVF